MFELHFGHPDETELSQRIQACSQAWKSTKADLIDGLYSVVSKPDAGGDSSASLPTTPSPADLKVTSPGSLVVHSIANILIAQTKTNKECCII